MPAPRKTGLRSPASGDTLPYEKCWAKTTPADLPGVSVRDHCLNVGCVAEALLASLPPGLQALAPPGAAALAALHDVGKVSPGFQRKCEPWLKREGLIKRAIAEGWGVRESDHAKIGQFTVQESLSRPQLHLWAAAVGAHHGRIKGEWVQVTEPWEAERRRLAAELTNEFGPLPDQPPEEAELWFMAGLITVADWVGSDEKNFPQDAYWSKEERRRKAQAALENIGWRYAGVRPGQGFVGLFPEIQEANSLQTAAIQSVREPGIYVIEGPMGFGKTEAALAAAYGLILAGKATGIYFALPTQVTSNRIHLRMQPFIDRISSDPSTVRLAHSASWLVNRDLPTLRPSDPSDDEARDHVREGRSWFASSKRALLAQYGVGTIDQSLLGIVAAKHFFVRQFGLAGKVVILDEVHTYDLYTSTLIGALVKRLRELQCTVIILSATLTEKRRRELLGLAGSQPVSTAYPLVSGVSSGLIEQPSEPPPSKAVHIRHVLGAAPAREVLDRACHGDCVLWIRNTVDEAQETYRTLRAANSQDGPDIGLLHSRFPFFRREEIEADWMSRLGKGSQNRPPGCVLVSTQVAEQSVDIDADLLITDLAPTDMLLQRLGRLWRHERGRRPCDRPEVWIQMPHTEYASLREADEKELRKALGKSARVYAPYVLLRSLEQWRARTVIRLPDDIRSILEATYADPGDTEPIAWRRLREELDKQKEKMAGQALTATSVWSNPALPDEEGVQTRYGGYSVAQTLLATDVSSTGPGAVRVRMLDGTVVTANEREWKFETAKAIHRNLVKVPLWAVPRDAANPPGCLTNYVAGRVALGVVQTDGTVRWTKGPEQIGVSYNADQGIILVRGRILPTSEEDSEDEYFD